MLELQAPDTMKLLDSTNKLTGKTNKKYQAWK